MKEKSCTLQLLENIEASIAERNVCGSLQFHIEGKCLHQAIRFRARGTMVGLNSQFVLAEIEGTGVDEGDTGMSFAYFPEGQEARVLPRTRKGHEIRVARMVLRSDVRITAFGAGTKRGVMKWRST